MCAGVTSFTVWLYTRKSFSGIQSNHDPPGNEILTATVGKLVSGTPDPFKPACWDTVLSKRAAREDVIPTLGCPFSFSYALGSLLPPPSAELATLGKPF